MREIFTNHWDQSCGTWTSLGTYFESRPAVQWRLPLGLQILTPLLLVCGSFWMPESPRWLIGRDRYQEGKTVVPTQSHHQSSG